MKNTNMKRKYFRMNSKVFITACLLGFLPVQSQLTFANGANSALASTPQPVKVTGKVVDAKTGEPVIGCSVQVKGSGAGAITDSNGSFKLDVPEGSMLTVSYIGYEKIAVKASSTALVIKLEEDTKNLSEVVVTALGIKRDKKALGYAMSSLKGEDLFKAGSPNNPLSSLYGKAAGVKVSATAGGSSAGMVVNIRNSVSLTEQSNTRPLMVVDGVPIFDENTGVTRNDRNGRDRGTGINDINPNDIESMDILKGAKAAVLYGYAGANGVILITTKSGSKKKGFGVEANVSYTWENVAYLPELQNEFGTGGNVALGNRDPKMVDKDGFLYTTVNGTKTKTYFNQGTANFGPKMDGSSMLWWDGQMRDYSPQADNYKTLYQTGHMTTANVVLSNGGELGSYRASYTAKKYDGVQFGSSVQNHNFSLNAGIKISDRVKLSAVTNYYYSKNENAPYAIQDMVTYGIPRDAKSDMWSSLITDPNGYFYFRDNSLARNAGNLTTICGDYLWSQKVNSNSETKHHLVQSADLNVKLAKGLSFKLLSGFDMTRRMLEVKKSVMKPLSESPFGGFYYVGERNIFDFYTQAHLNLDTKITDDLHLTALVGTAYQNNADRQLQSTTQDFLVENWFSLGNSSRSIKSEGGGSRTAYRTYSTFASAQLAYKDYLYLELQARNDWSSILPPANNSYFYPGASVSWVASQSLKLPEVIQFAKARLSWADVGRPGSPYFGNFAYSINSYGGVPYESMSGELPPLDYAAALVSGKMPEENLRPERKREFELGLEMNFFKNNRFGFDFSAYRSNTYDQILALDVPRSSGASKVRSNAGDVQQTGFELQLKGKPVYSHDFKWESVVNLANVTTKINKLASGITILPLWGATGAMINAVVGGQYGEIFVNPYKTNDKGERVVSSLGVYETDKTQLKKVGKVLPDVTGGFINNFTYKRFTLGVDMDFQFGGTMISQTNMYLKGNGSGKESLQYRNEAHGGAPYYVDKDGNFVAATSHTATVPADAKYNFLFHDGVILPGVKADGTKNDKLICAEDYYTRSFWNGDMAVNEDIIYKTDYISLRRITLSYGVPEKLTRKLGINNVQISAYGSNLLYLYRNLPNVTPESTLSTNSYTESTAASAVRMFGVELKFAF
jgi:TonB-linked SusC/RagA family outer membrane protein